MISPALQLLYDEHETILSAIERLRTALSEPDLSCRSDELRAMLSFFREDADAYHHRKEEDVLFVALAEANPGVETLTGSLAEHHELFRETLALAEEAITTGDWDSARATLDTYASDLIDHISAENDELFVAADDMMNESELERLYYRFLDTDNELGLERKQELEGEMSHV